MGEYEDFMEGLKFEITKTLAERGYAVDIDDIVAHKANQDAKGIVVRLDEANVSPTIYTESIFEDYKKNGISVQSLAENLADTTEAAYKQFEHIGFNPENFNADYIRENSYLAVVNTDINQELLSRVPNLEIPSTDLSVYAKVHVGEDASITITNDHAFIIGMTGNEILEEARNNTLSQEFSVRSMKDTISELMADDVTADGLFLETEELSPSMVVITNESKIEGANAILSSETLDKACREMGCESLVIIPSSRHEILGVNPDGIGIESTSELKSMVEEVNATQVDLEDKLSDNIYKYNSNTKDLTMCNEEGLFHDNAEIEVEMGIEAGAGR